MGKHAKELDGMVSACWAVKAGGLFSPRSDAGRARNPWRTASGRRRVACCSVPRQLPWVISLATGSFCGVHLVVEKVPFASAFYAYSGMQVWIPSSVCSESHWSVWISLDMHVGCVSSESSRRSSDVTHKISRFHIAMWCTTRYSTDAGAESSAPGIQTNPQGLSFETRRKVPWPAPSQTHDARSTSHCTCYWCKMCRCVRLRSCAKVCSDLWVFILELRHCHTDWLTDWLTDW